MTAPLAAAPRRKPNILWIMADDMGIGDLGCYGQRYIKTPNADSLARDGMQFSDAYAGCTVCAPSRSVLMTGLHTGHTPIRSNPGGVPILPGETTVAEVLKSAGYATALFGKWGLGDIGTVGVPWKHGFDEFCGFLHQAHAHFQYPRFLYHNDRELPLPGNGDKKYVTYANDVMAERSLQWIRSQKDKPFFGYLSYTIPHFEPLAPEDSMREYRGKFPEGKPWGSPNGRLAASNEVRTAYAAMVSRVDRYLGQVLALLKELRLENDTIVFFTSDNGGALPQTGDNFFNAHLPWRGSKGTMYENGIRVPMLVRWPGVVKPGSTSDIPWYFADFLPTAAAIAGAKAPTKLDGVSVLPALQGKPMPKDRPLYWELPRYNNKTGEFLPEIPMQAMRKGAWKAVRPKADQPLELYNLAEDPGEKTNRAASERERNIAFERELQMARTPPRAQKENPHPWWDARS